MAARVSGSSRDERSELFSRASIGTDFNSIALLMNLIEEFAEEIGVRFVNRRHL
jgi:hypothetical protein